MRHPQSFPSFLTALAAALLAATAYAEDGENTPKELETVRATATREQAAATSYSVRETAASTKLALSPRETPQSVTVVTQQRISDQNLQSLRDVLDNVTGVYSFAYDTERVGFTARGSSIDNTSLDGVPTLSNFDTQSADATLDTALYERIEIVRGATGLLTGPGNPSATINLVRKHADSREPKAAIKLSAGSWNNYRSEVDASAPLTEDGKLRARVIGVYQDRDDYIDRYSNEKKVLYTVLDANITPSTVLSVGHDFQKTQPNGNTWGSFPLFYSDGSRTDYPTSLSTSAKWSFWDKTTQTTFADLMHSLDNDWLLRASFSHRETDGDMALFYVEGFPDKNTGLGLTPWAYRAQDHNQLNSFDVYGSGPFQLLGREHELVLGATTANLNRRANLFPHDPSAMPPMGSFNDWSGDYPAPVFSTEPMLLTRIGTKQAAAYSSARFSLADPLKLITGVRYTRWKTNSYDVYNDSTENVYQKNAVTPYAGLVYDINEQLSTFASYTQIFKPQDRRDVTGTYLDPVTGKSMEIGIKGEHFNRRLNTALTLYKTQSDNVAELDGTKLLPDGITKAYRSVDGTEARGFEMEVNGELQTGWNASLGWSHNKVEDGENQAIQTYVPRTLVRAFTTWQVPGTDNKLTLGGGANWQSKTNLGVGCPSGLCRVEQDDVTLVSLLARYQFTPKISAQLNGNNLLNEKYYVLDEYGNLYFGTPANATLSLSYAL